MSKIHTTNPVISYYKSSEAFLGYSLVLHGVKHFGYYPKGKEHISIAEAQELLSLRIGKKLGLPKGSLVLDAGCGEGPVSVSLAKKYKFRIEGVDLLDFNVARAQKRAKKNGVEELTHFQVADYSKLNYPDNHFDGVIMVETLVHAPDFEKVLKELHRILKPGGKIVLDEYTKAPREQLTSKQNAIFDELIDLVSMPSFNYFLHDSFPGILKKIGFDNVEVENISERIVPMTKKLRKLALVFYPVVRLLRLQKHFVNNLWGLKHYGLNKSGAWRFNITSATKPR